MNRSFTTAVALLALVGAGAAYAQMGANSGAQPEMKTMMHARHSNRMQMHLDKLKTQLKITTAQESAWNGFTQALMNMHPGMNMKMQHKAMSVTAPEFFSGMVEHAQARVSKAQQLAKAADKLYGQLSSEQKGAFNMAVAMMHGKMHKAMHKMHAMHSAVGGHG